MTPATRRELLRMLGRLCILGAFWNLVSYALTGAVIYLVIGAMDGAAYAALRWVVPKA